ERGAFHIGEALSAETDKLVRRHPHVFREDGQLHDTASKSRAPSADAALARWDAQKAKERSGSGLPHGSLGDLPKTLPALLAAYKVSKRAAAVGFDWARAADVFGKIEEELGEVRDTLAAEPSNLARVEEEVGDLLFAAANLARKLDIEPE